MEEVQYKKGLILILTKWKYIVIGMLFVAIVAAVLLPALHKDTYVASISIALSAADIESLNNNLKQNEQLVYNYNSLIKSDALIAEIIEKNNYNYSINQVKSMIESEILEDTTIINIKVKNSDEAIATQILTDVIDKLREEVKTIYFVDNIHTIKNILVEKDENFNLSIMLVGAIALGGILTIGIIALITYFRKVIMVERDENKISDVDIVAKLKNKFKGMPEEFNNMYLFLKKNSSKIIGFMDDKYCCNKENIIIETSKNLNDKKILIIKYGKAVNSPLSVFQKENEYYKKKKQLKFKNNIKGQDSEKDDIELFTTKNNSTDILVFNTSKAIMEFACEASSVELLQKLFDEYDYVFIGLDSKASDSGTKVFCGLSDTVFILCRNYLSKEKYINEAKRFCIEEKVKNIGILLFKRW